jgi:hypothetical protein
MKDKQHLLCVFIMPLPRALFVCANCHIYLIATSSAHVEQQTTKAARCLTMQHFRLRKVYCIVMHPRMLLQRSAASCLMNTGGLCSTKLASYIQLIQQDQVRSNLCFHGRMSICSVGVER